MPSAYFLVYIRESEIDSVLDSSSCATAVGPSLAASLVAPCCALSPCLHSSFSVAPSLCLCLCLPVCARAPVRVRVRVRVGISKRCVFLALRCPVCAIASIASPPRHVTSNLLLACRTCAHPQIPSHVQESMSDAGLTRLPQAVSVLLPHGSGVVGSARASRCVCMCLSGWA